MVLKYSCRSSLGRKNVKKTLRRIIAWCHCCRGPPSKHDATWYPLNRLRALFSPGSANQTAICGLQSHWKILDCSGHGLKRSSTIGVHPDMETPHVTKAESACLAHPAREAMSRKTCPKTSEPVQGMIGNVFCFSAMQVFRAGNGWE